MHGVVVAVSFTLVSNTPARSSQTCAVSANSQHAKPALFQFVEAVMKRHALAGRSRRVLLLALTVVSLLAAVSDGIRLAPADAKLLRGQQERSTAESQGSGGVDGGSGLPPPLQDEVRATTGSSLPDCTHACGACSPCNRVMVSFKCSAAEPVPCPMVYRCMCRGKCYPVPSS